MSKKVTSRPGFFRAMLHYDEKGRKIGEIRPGLFGDMIHSTLRARRSASAIPGFWAARFTPTTRDAE